VHDNRAGTQSELNLKSKPVFEEIGCALARLLPVLDLLQDAYHTGIFLLRRIHTSRYRPRGELEPSRLDLPSIVQLDEVLACLSVVFGSVRTTHQSFQATP
jgi:hypothetical protein